jgi:hypothetical protein
MNIVGPSLSAGLAALQALTPPPSQSRSASAAQAPAQIQMGISRTVLSPSAGDALIGLNVRAPNAAAPASKFSEAFARAGIPAEKAAWLETLGADNWALHRPAALDDAAFEKQALSSMSRSGTSKLPGFAEALADGTLRIQRATDMPELGYKSFQLVLFKDGAEFGGAGFGTMNNDRWTELRRSGTFAATGSVRGNDYVATWPLAWNGDDAAQGAAKAA